MNATLNCWTDARSPASAIARLRVWAAEIRHVNDEGTPRNCYARALLSTLSILETCYANGHTTLIRELWRTARATADRLAALPPLYVC